MMETFTWWHKRILEQKTMNAVIIGIPVSTETYSCKFAFDAVSDARRRTALVTDVWAILSL